MNNKIIFLIILFLTQCGYSSVYNQDSSSDIRIILTEMTGDKEFNNQLNSKLRRYYDNESSKIYKISINSSEEKKTIAKDSTGKISDYELILETEFKIEFNNINKIIKILESLKIKNNDDIFEQARYEKVIKSNFADSMKNKLLVQLKYLYD